MRLRFRWILPISIVAAAMAACSTLVGDFTVGSIGRGGDGGGGAGPSRDAAGDAVSAVDGSDARTGDAAVADGSDGRTGDAAVADGSDARMGDAAVADGGDSGDGAALACTTWKWPQPIVVEDLSNAPVRRYSGRYAAFAAQLDVVRIVASKAGSPAFSVYTVVKSTMQVQQLDATSPAGSTVVDVRHVASAVGGTTAVVLRETPDASASAYYAVAFGDLIAATGPLPPQFSLFVPPAAPQSVSSLQVLPFSTMDIFEAVSVGTGNPASYALGVGRVSTSSSSDASTLSTVAASVNVADFANPHMIHANGNVYIVEGNDVSTAGCTGWTVPDTAAFSAMPPRQTIASGSVVNVYDFGPSSASAAANILTMETQYSGQFTSGIKFMVGVVAYANLSTWTTANLAALNRTTNVFRAPVGVPPSASWFGDDIMLLGPGLHTADGGIASGLNVLWVNASGAIRCDQTGAAEILNDRADFVMAAAVPARIAASSAAWDIVWVESANDSDGGVYDVMKMNELLCQ